MSADFGYLQLFRRYSRSKSEVIQNRPKFCTFLAPVFFFGECPPNFWTCIIKLGQIPTMWQSFRAIGQGNSENAWRKKRKKERKTSLAFYKSSRTTVTGGLIIQDVNFLFRHYNIMICWHRNKIESLHCIDCPCMWPNVTRHVQRTSCVLCQIVNDYV